MSSYKKLVWEAGQKEEVELSFDQPITKRDEKYNRNQYWYGIKETITGHNGFSATEKLHQKIQDLGAKKGDKIIIEKVNNGTITYFTVELPGKVANNSNTNIAPASNNTDIYVKDIKAERPIESIVNELVRRVEKLENSVSESKNGNKPVSEDDIPF
tara:strand:- start:1075 stop:1545 length:471 start_codon:yes stop_codon:yes gene_type:complete